MLFSENRTINLRSPRAEDFKKIKTFKDFRDAGITFGGGYEGFQKEQSKRLPAVAPQQSTLQQPAQQQPAQQKQPLTFGDDLLKVSEDFIQKQKQQQKQPLTFGSNLLKISEEFTRGLKTKADDEVSGIAETIEPIKSPFNQAIEQATRKPPTLNVQQEKALQEGQMIAGRTPMQAREASQARGQELGLGTDIPTTQSAIAERRLQSQAERRAFSEEDEKRIKELEDLGLANAAEGIKRLSSAASARFSGREGAISGARAGLPSAISVAGKTKLNIAQKNIEVSRKRRERLEQQKRNAEQDQNNALAGDLQREIDAEKLKEANEVAKIQNAITESEADFEKSKAELTKAETAARTEARAGLTFLSKNPLSLAGASPDAISALLSDAGINPNFASGLIAQGKLAQNLKGIEQEQALADLHGTIDNLGTETDKNIEGFQALERALARGNITQEAFDSLSIESGFAQKPEKSKTRLEELKEEQLEIKNKIEREKLNDSLDNGTFKLKDTRLVEGGNGASNGSGRSNPTEFISQYTFDPDKKVKSTDVGVMTDINGNQIARVTSGFGSDLSHISGEKQHNAIDLAFKDGNVIALVGGTIVNAGTTKRDAQGNLTTYGGWVQIMGDDGKVLQYSHLNVDDVKGLESRTGEQLELGQEFAKQETRPSEQGTAKGAHTDLRYVGTGSEGLKESDRAILKIQIGKAAFGTRISNEEGEKVDTIIESVIKENPNLSVPEMRDSVIDKLVGFTITDNKDFAEAIKESLIVNAGDEGLSGIDARGISRLINAGKLSSALRKSENVAMINAKKLDPDGFIGESIVKTAVERGTKLIDSINELENSPIGVVSGTMEKWLRKLKGERAQDIKSQIISQVAAMRNRLSGTAVTESEEKFLEPLIPDINDSPDNFMIKLNQLKENPLVELNNIRDIVGLPEVDENSLINQSERVKLYEDKIESERPKNSDPLDIGIGQDPLKLF